MVINMLQSYDQGDLSTIPTGTAGVLGTPPSTVYSGRKFTAYFLNKGGTTLIIQFFNSVGAAGKRIVLAPNDPGVTLDNIPWDLLGGGITALSNTSPGTLLWSFYSTDGIVPDLPADAIIEPVSYGSELPPLTIKLQSLGQ